MKEKRVVIIITAIVSVLVIAIAITSVFLLSPGASYTRTVREAENLVADGDYENAVLAYQEAIEKDPENVEAYLGLANVYEKSGELSLAIQTLETGYRRTKSAQIKVLLNRMVETEEETVSSETLAFNDELLSMFSTYREEDYEEQYGRSDGRRDARFEGLDAEIRFDEDGIPTEIHLDDILTLFDTDKPIPIEELDEMLSGNYRTTSSASHGEMVIFESNGTEVTIALIDDAVTADSYNSIVPLNIEKEVEEPGETATAENTSMRVFTGQTVTMENETVIGNVGITVYKGSNEKGSVIWETTSDANGNFSFSVEENINCYAVLVKGEYKCELNLNLQYFSDGIDLGIVRLHKISEEIEIVLEKNADLTAVTSSVSHGNDFVGLTKDESSWLIVNGEVTAYRYTETSGVLVREVTRIIDRKKPWGYKLDFKYGKVPFDVNFRVILREPGQPEQVFVPEPDRVCDYWNVLTISDKGELTISDVYLKL